MTWKLLLALVSLILLGVLGWSIYNRSKWIERDVDRQFQIAELLQEAEEHGAEAALQAERSQKAEETALEALAAKAAAEGELDDLRKKHRNRPAPTNLAQCRSQLGDCDALVLELDDSLKLSDDAVFGLSQALTAERAASEAWELRGDRCCDAQRVERARVKTWQQQTKRGRVKTAFFGIGMALGGGAAGYGIRAGTE